MLLPEGWREPEVRAWRVPGPERAQAQAQAVSWVLVHPEPVPVRLAASAARALGPVWWAVWKVPQAPQAASHLA